VGKSKLSPESYTIYIEGRCTSKSRTGSFAAIVICDATQEKAELVKTYKPTNRERIEIIGAVAALEKIPAGSIVHLYSTSQILLAAIADSYNPNKNQDLLQMLKKAATGKTIKFTWLRPNIDSTCCDQLLTMNHLRAGEVLEDIGFDKFHNTNQEERDWNALIRKKAMDVRIEIPDEINCPKNVYSDPETMAVENGLNISCAKKIITFLEKNSRSFSAYKRLNVGGRDKWSRTPPWSLKELFGEKTISLVLDHLTKKEDILKALRWHGRGLPLSDSIRKVLVDNAEITEDKATPAADLQHTYEKKDIISEIFKEPVKKNPPACDVEEVDRIMALMGGYLRTKKGKNMLSSALMRDPSFRKVILNLIATEKLAYDESDEYGQQDDYMKEELSKARKSVNSYINDLFNGYLILETEEDEVSEKCILGKSYLVERPRRRAVL